MLRVLDALTGLLAAGMLVVGVGLLLAQLFAPALLSAAGWGAATGPGWVPVVAHLLVGAVGEVVYRARRSRTRSGRMGSGRTGSGRAGSGRAGSGRAATGWVVADLAVVVGTVAVIARAWWP